MIGVSEERISQSKVVGNGSREHEAFDSFLTIVVLSSTVLRLE